MLTSLLLLTTLPAHAAKVTDLPPQWRGDFGIGYGVTVVPDSLVEDEVRVGNRRSIDHQIDYTGRLGFTDYLAFEVVLPHHASSRLRFSDSSRMDGVSDSEVSGKGMGGTWLRLLFTPFSETTFASRGDQVSWLLGLGMQTENKTSFWAVENGERGAGPASSAFEFQSFWSVQNSRTEPYLGVNWTRRSATKVGGVAVQDPSSVDLVTGMEILLWEDPTWANGLGSELALDLSVTFGHQTWGDGISGLQLPSVLSISDGTSVTRGETQSLWGGFGLRWQPVKYVDWTLQSAIGGPFGHRIEHPYSVASTPAGKLGWTIGTDITFRLRDPLFDAK
jgi:hypothetical protein